MNKLAGLLDNPRKTLPEDIWDLEKMDMRPKIRDHILRKLSSFMPYEIIKEIFVIGSITGYKYKDTSDIDVNVKVDVTKEKVKELGQIADMHNGELAVGTRHPINFHVEKFHKKSTPESWQDYKFGNYDLIKNQWLKTPPDISSIRNPQDQFRQELMIAQMIANKWLRSSEELRKDLHEYKELESDLSTPSRKIYLQRKQNEIAEDIKELIFQAKKVKKDRKEDYALGFGIPRENFDNIVYKLIEHGQYGELFELLKGVKKDEIDESIKGIF